MNLSPNYWGDRTGWSREAQGYLQFQPEIIVLHLTEGSFEGSKSWLCNPESEASSTYLMAKSGDFVTLVDEKDAPWTNGFRQNQTVPPTNAYVRDRCWGKFSPNLITISVEIEWFQSDGVIPTDSALYHSLADLVANICYVHTLDPRTRIMGHHEIDPEGKPFCGRHIPWDSFLRYVELLIRERKEGSKVMDREPSEWAKKDWEEATDLEITDGSNPHGTPTREQVVSMLMRLKKTMESK